jgi:regulatory protein
MSDIETPPPPGPKRQRTAPRPVTPATLERAALHYLERFQSSAATLRRVLMRRVRRSALLHDTDVAQATGWVEALIERYCRSGLVDDRTYAAARTASLHRRGASARGIGAKLASKGITGDLATETLRDIEDLRPGGDLAAAAILARRRRLGPYRDPAKRAELEQKDLATMARAGFDRRTAERVLGAADVNELERLVTEVRYGG